MKGPSRNPPSDIDRAEGVDSDSDAVDRRTFLAEAVGAAGVAAVSWFWFEGFGESGRPVDIAPTEPGAPGKTFNAQEWRTLEAACDRLLPSSGPTSPGARDVNAIGYLDAVLGESHVKKDWVPIVRSGAAKLDERARRMRARDFASLPPEKQDAAIRVFETTQDADGKHPGHQWLRIMLTGILEAFFGDPVHGGNTDEIAWTWAGHRPGFPRPTEKNWRPTERGA